MQLFLQILNNIFELGVINNTKMNIDIVLIDIK